MTRARNSTLVFVIILIAVVIIHSSNQNVVQQVLNSFFMFLILFFPQVYLVLTYLSGVLYFLSTAINPILYNIMSNKFRNAFKVRFVCSNPYVTVSLSKPIYITCKSLFFNRMRKRRRHYFSIVGIHAYHSFCSQRWQTNMQLLDFAKNSEITVAYIYFCRDIVHL